MTRPDAPVEGPDHRRVHALPVQLDMPSKGLIVLARRLQRRVGRPVRQVKEERPILVGLDDLDRLVRVVIRQVPGRLEQPGRH